MAARACCTKSYDATERQLRASQRVFCTHSVFVADGQQLWCLELDSGLVTVGARIGYRVLGLEWFRVFSAVGLVSTTASLHIAGLLKQCIRSLETMPCDDSVACMCTI